MRATSLAFVLLAAALSACSTVSRGLGIEKGAELSYAQVQTIQTGLTARQIRDAFGEPSGMDRGPDGKIRRMSYPVLDPQSKKGRLTLDFDAREMLVHKSYAGETPK